MSTSVTPEEHIALLVSCIKTLTGKIDFAAVARDCNIITAAAAQKRYSRLLKANETAMQTANANASGNTNANGEPAASSTTDQDQAPANGSPAKASRPAGNKAKRKAKTTSTESKPPRKKARAQKKKKTGQQEESEEEQVDDDIYEDAETGEEDVC
ncbi:hypothetical protein BJX68DRAFT_265266 [Aspergillus pseudodeflectus]|uniref:Myb-like DNA-binding domain-containing protein n=1 Tax=Aspergillus pseudodeflectus TaxID=176178 RepID=A0ABR4KL71_9EURO